MSRQDYRGAAAALALTSDLNDTAALTFAVSGDTSGWPSGASGRSFVAVIDRGTPKEEKVLCSTLAAGTMALSLRGYDGTSGKTHSSGAVVEHVGPSADKMDDVDAHVYDPTRDDHTQYTRIDGTRGFTGVDQITGTPSAVGGTQNQSGSALTLARSDHVHGIALGGIDDSGMFADGVVTSAAIGAASVGNTSVLVTGTRLHTIVADAAALALLVPTVGDTAYVLDTARYLTYVGPTNGWTPPWNLAWGLVPSGYATPASVTGVSTIQDLAGMTVTWTAVTNRLYRITAQSGNLLSTGASDIAELSIVDGSGILIVGRAASSTTSTDNINLQWIKSYTAGSQTVKARGRRVSGSGTENFGGLVFSVEDFGPNGLPS